MAKLTQHQIGILREMHVEGSFIAQHAGVYKLFSTKTNYARPISRVTFGILRDNECLFRSENSGFYITDKGRELFKRSDK